MTIRQLPSGRWTVPGASGAVASGWKVYTYIPGTTTAKATYTDYTGGTPNANPVVLDSRGEATIYWDGVYKVIVKDASDNTVWTEDNYGEGTTSVLQGNFNLVLNGSFEQDTNGDGDPDDWTVTEYTGGTAVLDTTEQIHGAQSLKFTSTGTGGGYATSRFFEVEGSKVYPVSFAILASVATVHNKVDMIWYTAAQAVISTTTLYDDTATNPTSWTDKSYTTTAPATARFAKVRAFGCVDDDAQAGSTWFDNVLVEHPTVLAGWFASVNGAVTATDEELNILDGVTATTAELNYADEPNAANKFCLLGSDARVPAGQKPAFRGALMYRTSAQTITGSGVVEFDSEGYDTDGLITSTTTFTIPAGVTKIRLLACVGVISTVADGTFAVTIYKDASSNYLGRPTSYSPVHTTQIHNFILASPTLVVAEGGAFTVAVVEGSSGTVTAYGDAAGQYTWFAIEIVE